MALTDYQHIRTALLVKIEVEEYYDRGIPGIVQETLAFTDHFSDYTYDGDTYTALGNLLSITSSTAELTPTSNSVSIAISGIPNDSIIEIVNSKIKASPVTIYRAFFDHEGNFINDGTTTNPIGRFRGFVNNYSLDEEWNQAEKTASNIITLDCASTVDILAKKSGGRKTNPTSMRKHYPNDPSFDRTPILVGANTNFGRQ